MDATATPTAALSRLLQPLTRSLNAEAAKALAELQVDPEVQQRIAVLAEKCNEGLLSDSERAEYEGYVDGADVLAILKLIAHDVLAGRSQA